MRESQRLGAIDGLRGIAILLVVWYHIWQITWMPAPLATLEAIPETGFVGVELFFFLSGFVIVFPFVRARADDTPAPTWRHFADRRFRKIVPAYVLSISLAFALGYAKFAPDLHTLRDIAVHLVFIHPWFADAFGSINGVLWSLGVEVQFYCIFPLVWQAFSRAPVLTASIGIIGANLYRIAQAHCCLQTSAPAANDNLPGVFDLFALGMLSAWLAVMLGPHRHARRAQWLGLAVAACGAIGAAYAVSSLFAARTFADWPTAWLASGRTWLGVSFAAVALGMLFAPPIIARILANPLLLFYAAISYELYLYHQPIARMLLAAHVPPYSGSEHATPGWPIPYTIIAIALATLVAWLLTIGFERPILALRVRAPSARSSLRRSESPLP